MSKYIEFLGAPGSGKSYCASRLSKKMKQDYVEKKIFSPRFDALGVKYIWGIAVRLNMALMGLVYYGWVVFKYVDPRFFSGKKVWMKVVFNWLVVLGGYRVSLSGRLVILDQGMFQLLCSSIYRGVVSEGVNAQADLIREVLARGGGGTIVWVEADVNILHERLLSRKSGRSPLEKADLLEVHNAKKAAEKAKLIASKIESMGLIVLSEYSEYAA